jgi:immune inhibitor A
MDVPAATVVMEQRMTRAPRICPRAGFAACLLVAGMGFLTPGHAGPAAVVLPSPVALNALLTSTLRPPRDLYALTQRLKLRSLTPIDPYVRHQPVDYPTGSTTNFYLSNAKQDGFISAPATLVYKTAHTYFYVQQGYKADAAALARAADTFEQHSYAVDRATFGQEWSPGVDDDQHITIFNGLLPPAVAGYFSGEDLFPTAVNRFSNQRKMIFMNLTYTKPGSTYYNAVLAHEFQHMIHFSLHPADEAWINEGDSMLAEELNGYGDGGYAAIKDSASGAQLTTWDQSGSGQYYGGGYLWMLYLYEHYGGARLTRAEMAASSASNMAVFDQVLAKLGYHQKADDVFADWVAANFLNDRSLANGQYGYTRTAAKAAPDASLAAGSSYRASLPQYSASYIALPPSSGGAVTLRFAGQPTVPLLSTVVPAQGVWWSNRGDGVDTSLTLPAFDLRHTRHAGLDYQVWYDLEKDYDYGYVEVSTDGGATWSTRPTPLTTKADPNGANLGQGYTGSTCTAASRARQCWVQEHLDLSAYAGKQILVRFEQVTDDEYNGQGLAVAHLRLPELGFDGDSSGAGWQSAGWVRTGNTEVEHWIVQAIVTLPHGPATVLRLPVGADGQGSLVIPAGSKQVVVAVSPVAPLTTVPTTFSLSAGS